MLISIVGRRQMAGRGGGLMVEKEGGGVEMFDVFLFEN